MRILAGSITFQELILVTFTMDRIRLFTREAANTASYTGCVAVGGFGSDYSAGHGGGPVKTGGFTSRASGPYGGL